jgi:dCMP deaminase
MQNKIQVINENPIGSRPSWDEYFMHLAIVSASRSSCMNVHSGSVIVVENQIIATGYNGAPRGIKSCVERGGCFKTSFTGKKYEETMNSGTCIGVHSEMNALAHINKLLHKKTNIYTTIFPCTSCSKNLISNNIKKIIFKRGYDFEEMKLVLRLLEEAEVEVYQLDLSPERIIDISFNQKSSKFDAWTLEEKERILKRFK